MSAPTPLTALERELLEALRAIVRDLPIRRDWLDPDVERSARRAIRAAEEREEPRRAR